MGPKPFRIIKAPILSPTATWTVGLRKEAQRNEVVDQALPVHGACGSVFWDWDAARLRRDGLGCGGQVWDWCSRVFGIYGI